MLVFFLGFIISMPVFCQNQTNLQPDFASRKLVQTTIDSAKILFPKQPVLAFEYVESAISQALNSGYRYELAEGYFTLSGFNFSMNEYNKAILHASRALDIYKSLERWEKVYNSYSLVAESYVQQQDYANARLNYENAYRFAERTKKVKDQLKTRFNLANLELLEKDFEASEKLFLALKKDAQTNNDLNLIAEIDFKLGEIYALRGDLSRANVFYEFSNQNAFQTNNNDLINQTNERIVATSDLTDAGSNLSILNTLNQTATIFQSTSDTMAWMTNNAQMATFYAAQGQFQNASVQLQNNYVLSEKKGDLAVQMETALQLYEVYRQSGQNKLADRAYKKYLVLSDSLKNQKLQDQDDLIQNQLALRTVEKQIDNLERERELDQQTILLLKRETNLDQERFEQQRLLVYFLIGILIVFAGVSVFVYRNIKAKKRAHQLLYLKSLRAQMNPHFIFNSLNSVNNYIGKSDERAANKYLSKFAKLMRQVLEHSQVEFISLAQEKEVLQLYLELEHERFKDQFDYEFIVDPTLSLESITIPPMLVQPFIENAIWHGLRYRDTDGLLSVHITAREKWIEIAIKDNGIGRNKSRALKTENQKKHQSTGMQNVESRTELIKAVFKAKIDYEIIDLPNDAGTHILIKLYSYE